MNKKQIVKKAVKNAEEKGAGEKKEHMMPGGKMMEDMEMPMMKYKNLKKK